MQSFRRRSAILFFVLSLTAGLSTAFGFGQQVVQRGALGKPAQVMDETGQWSVPLLVASDHDVELYIPDLSTAEWLKENYSGYEDKGQYVLSMFTFYITPRACRANQIGWGNSDANHLDACDVTGYRVRQALVDTLQKTVTLQMAAMIGQDGQIEVDSVQQQPLTRTWSELDANTQEALKKANAFVAEQMRAYDRKVQRMQ